MKYCVKIFTIAIVAAIASSSASFAITHTLSGVMDPIQATTNPGNVGNGSGVIVGDYDTATMTLNYTLTWMDLTSDVTNMHFHLGAPGTAGGVQLGVSGPWSNPQIGTAVLASDREDNLLAGDWYLNIHTGDFGGGEIRGQVLVTPVPEPSVCGLLAFSFMTLAGFVRRR